MSRPAAPTTLSAPAAPGERLVAIDVLRGVALLGILLVNMLAFSGPFGGNVVALSYWQGGADLAVEWAIMVFAEGVFYTMFSFLFGLGFGLQLSRAEARGENATPRFRRRLLVLLGFGLVHLLLIWFGDILTHYALIGLLLLAFRNALPRTLWRWALGILALSTLIYLALGPLAAQQLAATDPAGLVQLYRDGNGAQILGERLELGFSIILSTPFLIPSLLWLFLLGLATSKLTLFENLAAHAGLLRRARAIALPVALVCKALFGWLLLARPGSGFTLALSTGLGGPALGIAYLTSLALLLSDPTWLARLRPLAAAGRMALSNYLAQSLVATLFFFGYGLGFYGRLGPATTILFTVGLFALQVVVSNLWLARFRFGLAEWLWRSLTYGRAQPWRRP